MAASTPLFASFDASDARRVNFSDVAPRTLSPPPPATASAPNLDLQQLEEAWTLRRSSRSRRWSGWRRTSAG